MRKITMLLLMLTLVTFAQASENAVPHWVQQKIQAYQHSAPEISARIAEYQGKTVYYIPPKCCDIPSELYDENGKLICYPDGGFVGGDGKCPGFKLE